MAAAQCDMSFFCPTKFVWRFGGNQARDGCRADVGLAHHCSRATPRPEVPECLPARAPAQVHLCGSFTRWVETVPMAPVEGQPDFFSVVVHLPPG